MPTPESGLIERMSASRAYQELEKVALQPYADSVGLPDDYKLVMKQGMYGAPGLDCTLALGKEAPEEGMFLLGCFERRWFPLAVLGFKIEERGYHIRQNQGINFGASYLKQEGYISHDNIEATVKTHLPKRWMRKIVAANMLLSKIIGCEETTVLPAHQKFSYNNPFPLRGTLEEHQRRMRALLDGVASDMKFVYDAERELYVFDNSREIPLERCLTPDERQQHRNRTETAVLHIEKAV